MTTTTPRLDNVERNLIINGNFDFWQRGTTFTAMANAAYSADRYQCAKVGTMVHTFSQSTDVPTLAQSGYQSAFSFLATVTTAESSLAAADVCLIRHKMEGYDYQNIHGKKCRFQFWVKASVTGIYNVSFNNNIQNRNYITTYTIASANTWQKVIIDLPLDTTGTWAFDNGGALNVNWALASGTNFQSGSLNTWQAGLLFTSSTQVNSVATNGNTFQLAQVMLIPQDFTQAGAATVDVPFQRCGRSISEELQKCQRYCCVIGGNATFAYLAPAFAGSSTTFALAIVNLPTQMRAVPTLTTSGTPGNYRLTDGTSTAAITAGPSIDIGDTTTFGVTCTATVTANKPYALQANGTVAGKLLFDAEL